MDNQLGRKNVNRLLWELSIPAMMGMLSTAVFNVADRYFVGRIDPLALTGVGITMPIQLLQMALVLLIGTGSSALVSIRLGERRKREAEEILFLGLKYTFLSMVVFTMVFLLVKKPLFKLMYISEEVLPFASPYITVIVVGGIFGIPGYCINNSLRSIGKAKVSMLAVLYSSLLNIILDPIFIFALDMGVEGAAIATVISQTAFTVFMILYFYRNKALDIHLKLRRVSNELAITKEIFVIGSPSLYVQILASAMNMFINRNFVQYGSDLDVAAITIIATIFSFYHLLVYGFVQGNQPIVGYNWGSGQYDRVRSALWLSMVYSFIISLALFLVIQIWPELLVSIFTDDEGLPKIASKGIRIYLLMLPLIGPQTISTQYFQAVGKPKLAGILSLLRHGIVIIPAVWILAPIFGVKGIYYSNVLSDFVACSAALFFAMVEIKKLRELEMEQRTIITTDYL